MQRRNTFTRRALIAGALAGAGGLGTGAWAMPRSGRTLRLGVIGCGQQGRGLIEHAAGIQGIRVAAVCDVQPARAHGTAASGDARVSTHWQELLESGVDAVAVAAQDCLHAEITSTALARGKHVYCERPLGLRLEEIAQVCRAARESGCLLEAGQGGPLPANCWDTARTLIDRGVIGPLRWAQVRQAGPASVVEGGDWRNRWDQSNGLALQHHHDMVMGLARATGARHVTRVSAAGGVTSRPGASSPPDALVVTGTYSRESSTPDDEAFTMVTVYGPLGPSFADSPTHAVIRGRKGYVRVTGEGAAAFSEDGAILARLRTRPRRGVFEQWLADARDGKHHWEEPAAGRLASAVCAMAAGAYLNRRTEHA